MTPRMKIVAGGLGGMLVLFVAAAAIVYANLTSIVRGVLEKQVPGLTFSEVEVGWNKVAVTGVELKRRTQTVFKVDALRVYPSMWSIFSDTLRISSIEVDAPYVFIVRNPDGSLKLPVPDGFDEQPSNPEKKKENAPDEAERPLAIRIDSFRIRDGKGDLVDRSVTGAPGKITLSALNVDVRDIQVPTGPDRIPFELSAQVKGRRTDRIAAEGWYDRATQSADVEFDLVDIFVPVAEPWYRGRHTTAPLADGALGMKVGVQMKNGAYTAKVALSLDDIAFAKEGLFLGVPTPVARKLLQDGKPLELILKFEGRLEDKTRLQQQILAALLEEIARRAGEAGVGVMSDELKKKGLNGATQAFGNLFGR